jgi:hypothetical protein
VSFLFKVFFEKERFHSDRQASPLGPMHAAKTALANLLLELNFTEI